MARLKKQESKEEIEEEPELKGPSRASKRIREAISATNRLAVPKRVARPGGIAFPVMVLQNMDSITEYVPE